MAKKSTPKGDKNAPVTDLQKAASAEVKAVGILILPPEPPQPSNPPAEAENPAKGQETASKPAPSTPSEPAKATPAPQKSLVAEIVGLPQGPGYMTCAKGGGTKVEVLGRDPRYKGEVWCKVHGSGDPWFNHYLIVDIEDTDGLWDFLGLDRPQREPQLAPEQDRHGVTYKDAIAQQKREVEALSFVLKPKHAESLALFCEKRNKPADPAEVPRGLHRVPRGVELTSWLIKRVEFFRE